MLAGWTCRRLSGCHARVHASLARWDRVFDGREVGRRGSGGVGCGRGEGGAGSGFPGHRARVHVDGRLELVVSIASGVGCGEGGPSL